MTIPESKFNDWKGTGADAGSRDAANSIETKLELSRSPLNNDNCTFEVRRQGSYKNTTHTWATSDVDVLVRLTSSHKRDLSRLSSAERNRYHSDNSSASYPYSQFKKDAYNWLKSKYKPRNVSWSGKAVEIDAEGTPLPVPADVVPCVEYRRYYSYPEHGDPSYDTGISFTPQTGLESFVNFPRLHYENGTTKHSNYKQTVRIFKNARDYYNETWSGLFNSIDAHSYGIECLIYNVPDNILKRSDRSQRFDEVLEFLEETDLSSFQQVSEMEALFGDSNTQWDQSEADELVENLRTMWEEW